MIHARVNEGRRDVSTSLKCDACSANSHIFLFPVDSFRTLISIAGLRMSVRKLCESTGWAHLPVTSDCGPYIADICPRCAANLAAVRKSRKAE